MNAIEDAPGCDTEAVNALLRGEMAAVETYTQALGTFADEAVIADLQKIRDEHSRSVRELRDQVIQAGGTPLETADPWGTFSASVAGGPHAIGPAAALAALRQGEEQRASEYEAALGIEQVPQDCQRAIRTSLLTACRKHVDDLNRLLGGRNG
jgi:hypothetical protein